MGHYAANALKTTKKTKHSYKKNVLQDHSPVLNKQRQPV